MPNQNGFHVEDTRRILEEAEAVIAPEPKRHIAHGIAHTMGRAAIANSEAAFIKKVLEKLIKLLYEEDSNGNYWNLSPTGRIDKNNIKMPWTPQGHKEWNVGTTHAQVLRHTLIHQLRRSPFVLGEDTHWYINLTDYPNKDVALNWLDRAQIDGSMWNQLMDQWKKMQPPKKRKKKTKKKK